MTPSPKQWSRAIILMDMNAFFASVEQRDRPKLRNRPIAITNGLKGSTIITSSYEARAYGIKTGMRLPEAKKLCADIIQCPADPHKYAAVSTTIMAALEEKISPDIEVFSVDEAFLDVTHCQSLLGTPENIARLTKAVVFEVSGLLCSVGVSGDKTTAKWAAKLIKPDGLTVVLPWESEQRLSTIPVTDLCGINKGIGGFLAQYGVFLCGDMKNIPISVLARRFGNLGKRIWYMAQGQDPAPLITSIAAPKTLGHGKVMPPATRDPVVLRTYLHHMCHKVAVRLRRHDLDASRFFIGMKMETGWLSTKAKCEPPTQHENIISSLCDRFILQYWNGDGVYQVQVTALNPRPAAQQADLFEEIQNNLSNANTVMDKINHRYGECTLAPASILNRSTMPNVIAPAWKPTGHRQTIK